MRIWNLDPADPCDRHLLGELREQRAVLSIRQRTSAGYRSHPETMRWRGRLASLSARDGAQVAPMRRRGFHPASPADASGDQRHRAD
jgi:pyrimidine dimer DNA glycosylase